MDQQQRKFNWWMLSTFILIGIVVGFSASKLSYFKTGGSQSQAATINENNKPSEQQTAPAEPQTLALTADQIAKLPDGDPVLGDANAPITIVEFTDFQCPYCSRFVKMTFPQIDENYIKTGKVKFVIRDFPLEFHAQSQLASQAAECANEQGKYKEMHDLIFDKQSAWSENEKAPDLMKGYAGQLSLDTKKFDACMSSQKYLPEIRKDLIDGATAGVSGTPAFFINGKLLSGAMPYDTIFKPILDAVLAGKQWEVQYDTTTRQPTVRVF